MLENFIKNWKDELRSKAKKKPGVQSISIVEIGEPHEKMLEKSKEVGVVGFVYRIPVDSGIDTKELWKLLRQAEAETGVAWLELPVPDFIDLAQIDEKYYKLPIGKGIEVFLNSQNSEEVTITKAGAEELGYCKLLEDAINGN